MSVGGAQPRTGSAAPLTLAMFVHAALALVAFASGESLLVAVATTSAALFFVAGYALWRKLELNLAIVTGFVLGNVIVFGYAHALYYYCTSLPRGVHHDVTGWLTALLCWSAVAGAIATSTLSRSSATVDTEEERERLATRPTLAVTGVAFLLMVIARLASGGLDMRWEDTRSATFGLDVLAIGLEWPALAVFFVMGLRIDATLTSPRTLRYLALVGLSSVIISLNGSRERSMVMMLLFLTGAGMSRLRRRDYLAMLVSISLTGAVLMFAVGSARTRQDFIRAPIDSRLAALSQEAQGAFDEGGSNSAEESAFEAVLGRAFEATAQLVIDDALAFRGEAGFEDFERLKHLAVPRFLAPDKQALEVGREVLIRDYGVNLSDTTSVPLPLVADAFRRGRWTWVLGVGFIAGAWLYFMTTLTIRVLPIGFRVLAVCLESLRLVRAYPSTVTGFIDVVTYRWVKIVLVVYVLSLVIRGLTMLVTARESPGKTGTQPRRSVRA